MNVTISVEQKYFEQILSGEIKVVYEEITLENKANYCVLTKHGEMRFYNDDYFLEEIMIVPNFSSITFLNISEPSRKISVKIYKYSCIRHWDKDNEEPAIKYVDKYGKFIDDFDNVEDDDSVTIFYPCSIEFHLGEIIEKPVD